MTDQDITTNGWTSFDMPTNQYEAQLSNQVDEIGIRVWYESSSKTDVVITGIAFAILFAFIFSIYRSRKKKAQKNEI